MIRPFVVDKRSPFLGESCALCKEPLNPGAEIVICPEDASRHHTHCWQANYNRCAAYGCAGEGEIEDAPPPPARTRVSSRPSDGRRSKVRVMPSSSYGCAQGCLLVSIALSILLFAVGCFGLWAIADYVAIEIFGWQYRPPLTGALPDPALYLQLPAHLWQMAL